MCNIYIKKGQFSKPPISCLKYKLLDLTRICTLRHTLNFFNFISIYIENILATFKYIIIFNITNNHDDYKKYKKKFNLDWWGYAIL